MLVKYLFLNNDIVKRDIYRQNVYIYIMWNVLWKAIKCYMGRKMELHGLKNRVTWAEK